MPTFDVVRCKELVTNEMTMNDNLVIANDSTDSGISVTQSANTGSGYAAGIFVENTANNDRGLYVYSNEDGSSSRELVLLKADNAAFDKEILYIANDGVGIGCLIDQNGAKTALEIDQDASGGTNCHGIYIDMGASVGAGSEGLHIKQNAAAVAAIYLESAADSGGTGLLDIVNTANNGVGLRVLF